MQPSDEQTDFGHPADPHAEETAPDQPTRGWWARYWPVVLFVLANVAAIALVIRAWGPAEEPNAQLSPVRRPADHMLDPVGTRPLDTLTLEEAQKAADVPPLFEWHTKPGTVAPTVTTTPLPPPRRPLLERLAMGLADVRQDARLASESLNRRIREDAVGIRPSTFNLGGFPDFDRLPPIGDPLLPSLTLPLIPPASPLGLTQINPEPVELDPSTMTPEYMAKLIAELQRLGQPFHFVMRGQTVPGVPPSVPGAENVPPLLLPGVTTRPVPGSGQPGVPVISGPLPAPPTDIDAAPIGPQLTVVPPPPTDPVTPPTPATTPTPGPTTLPAPPRDLEPEPDANDPLRATRFASSALPTQAAAETAAEKLRASGQAASVAKVTGGWRVVATVTIRRSERTAAGHRLSTTAGVTLRYSS